MKKIFAAAFLGTLAVSCSKKEKSTETNVMLEEPKVEITDSASVTKPSEQEASKTDSITVKVDSATTK